MSWIFFVLVQCNLRLEGIETMYHTYLECEITKLFWKELKRYIYSKLHVHKPITNQEIILACRGEDQATFNIIYLLQRNIYTNTDAKVHFQT